MSTRESTPAVEHAAPNGAGSVAVDEPIAESARPRKRVFIGIGVAIAIVLLLVFGVPWLSYTLSHESTDDAAVDADAVAVTSRIPERIDRIAVNTNQEVKRGQLLIVLDNKDELAKLKAAQAQYDLALADQRTTTEQGQGGVSQAAAEVVSARAQVPVAQAGVAQAAAAVRSAQAALPAAQASYAKARADFRRTQSLVSTGDEPVQQLDAMRAEEAAAVSQMQAAQNQVAQAQAGYDAALQRVNAASAQVGSAGGQLVVARGRLAQAADPSQVESAKAQLELAKQSLGYTHIYASTNGFIGEKSVEVGQTVSAGMTLLTIIPHRVYITANYKETQVGGMRVGQPVDIHVDAYGGVTFHGTVASINPASQNTYALVPAQNATGNFVKVTQRIPVRIDVIDQRADMPLRPGMSVETYVKIK